MTYKIMKFNRVKATDNKKKRLENKKKFLNESRDKETHGAIYFNEEWNNESD